MMTGFCPRGFCPERAYVLMELCMEGVLSKGVLSGGGFVRRGFCPISLTYKFPLSAHSGRCFITCHMWNHSFIWICCSVI